MTYIFWNAWELGPGLQEIFVRDLSVSSSCHTYAWLSVGVGHPWIFVDAFLLFYLPFQIRQ